MHNKRHFYLFLALLSIYLILLILNQLQILDFILGLIRKMDFLLLSAMIAFLFEPIINCIPLKNRVLCCTIIYLGLLIVVSIFIILVIPVLFEQLNSFYERFNMFFEFKQDELIHNIIAKEEWSSRFVSAVSSASNAFVHITDFFLLYLASYFISLDLESILKWIKKKVRNKESFFYFYSTCTSAIYHYIQGLCLDLLVLFLLELGLLWVLKFSYPLTFAFVTIMLNLIPYVGATIAQFLVMLVDFNQCGYFRFELFLFGFLLQQIESNIIQPYIFSKVLKLKPIVTLISILIFGYLFGLVGFILAPIFAVVVQLAYRSLVFANDKKTVGTWKNVWYNFEEIGEEDK